MQCQLFFIMVFVKKRLASVVNKNNKKFKCLNEKEKCKIYCFVRCFFYNLQTIKFMIGNQDKYPNICQCTTRFHHGLE
jgi:hypothetical protein